MFEDQKQWSAFVPCLEMIEETLVLNGGVAVWQRYVGEVTTLMLRTIHPVGVAPRQSRKREEAVEWKMRK